MSRAPLCDCETCSHLRETRLTFPDFPKLTIEQGHALGAAWSEFVSQLVKPFLPVVEALSTFLWKLVSYVLPNDLGVLSEEDFEPARFVLDEDLDGLPVIHDLLLLRSYLYLEWGDAIDDWTRLTEGTLRPTSLPFIPYTRKALA